MLTPPFDNGLAKNGDDHQALYLLYRERRQKLAQMHSPHRYHFVALGVT